MPYFKSLPEDAGPPNIFTTYPEICGPWSTMSQALMNGPSPLSPGERELILAFAAGVAGCDFVYMAHAQVERDGEHVMFLRLAVDECGRLRDPAQPCAG